MSSNDKKIGEFCISPVFEQYQNDRVKVNPNHCQTGCNQTSIYNSNKLYGGGEISVYTWVS